MSAPPRRPSASTTPPAAAAGGVVSHAERAAVRALVAYHWRAGARASLRAGIILACGVVFAFGSAPNPAYLLRETVLAVVGDRRGPEARVLLAGLCVAFAAIAAPRVTVGTGGWLRSLPASANAARRAAAAALCLAQIPVAVAVALACVATPLAYGARLDAARVASVPLLIGGAALLVLRVSGPGARPLAAAALAAAASGTWLGALAAAALLAAADRVGGALATRRRAAARRPAAGAVARPAPAAGTTRRRAPGAWRRRAHGARAVLALTARALGTRRVAGELLPALLPLAAAYFVRANNPTLARATADTVARVCGGLAATLAVAGLANAVLVRRAAWSWARSLPWSSAERVAADATALAIGALPAAACAGAFGAGAAAVAGAAACVAAAAGAAAIRAGGGRHTGAAGEVLVLAAPYAVIAGLWPLVALASVPLTALGLAVGARRERAAAGRWTELRHGMAGDPGWISPL